MNVIITPREYEAILRNDLMTFIERSFYELNPGRQFVASPFIELLAMKLELCRLGRIRRLIVNLPPRHLKSICASVAFVAWLLGHQPGAHIICVSYGQELADRFGRDTRTLMLSDWYRLLFSTRLAPDRQAVHDFWTVQQGSRRATSVEGVLTGLGADYLIIDDPLKPDEALSDTRRSGVNVWFDNTLRSRLNNKETGCIIIVMQRVHMDDLVGHVLAQGEDWDVLSLPAIAEEDEHHVFETSLGRGRFVRSAGGVLQPERESLATLLATRQAATEYNFQAQYQQNPVPLGGMMVKREWLRTYGALPQGIWLIVQSWDTANKTGELNDYSVCTTWGYLDGNYYLIDVFRKRLLFPDLRRAVIEEANRHGATVVLIEDKASGTPLIQELSGELPFVKPYKPPAGVDKVMRLHTVTHFFENGKIHLPENAPWLAEYVRELTSFPASKYADQVDSTTQALDYMRGPGLELAVWERLGRL